MPRTLNLTAEEKIQRKKDQDKARSKRFYDREKAKISASRKIARSKCQKLLQALGMDEINLETNKQSVNAIATEIKEHIIEEEALANPQPQVQPQIEEKPYDKKAHNGHIRTVARILGRDVGGSGWDKAFVKFNDVIKKIESARKTSKNKEGNYDLYADNSKKGYYQAILTEVDQVKYTKDGKRILLSPKAREAYDDMLTEGKYNSFMRSKEKRETEEVMDFDEYIEKIANKFGKDSSEALIAAIYKFHLFRDNLVLKILPKQIKDESQNYIIVPELKTSNITIINNDYKTSKKYGQKIISIPQALSKHIRKYMNDNKLTYNDYLFGESKLSGDIIKFNKKAGLDIGVNKFRKMRVSPVLNNPTVTVKERIKLGKEAGHSPITAMLSYQHTVKPKETQPIINAIEKPKTKTKATKEKKTKTLEV